MTCLICGHVMVKNGKNSFIFDRINFKHLSFAIKYCYWMSKMNRVWQHLGCFSNHDIKVSIAWNVLVVVGPVLTKQFVLSLSMVFILEQKLHYFL